MFKKLNNLSFVIGLFFVLISFILLADCLLRAGEVLKVNLYSGIVFLVFGLIMLILKSEE